MYETLEFVNGLNKSEANVLSWENVKSKINDKHNYFEITRPNKPIRIYVDIDGKANPNISEDDFYDTVNEVNEILSAHTDEFVIIGSSKYNHTILKKQKEECVHKYSWRLTYKSYINCISNMSKYVKENIFPVLKDNLEGIIDITWDKQKGKEFDCLDIDPSVYRFGFGKMRTVNAYKHATIYEIDRINKIINGNISDHFIHYIDKECEFIDIVEIPKPTTITSTPTPKTISENKRPLSNDNIKPSQMEDLLINFLGNEIVSWSTYFLVGTTLSHNGYEFELFDSWCKLSSDYNGNCNNKTDWNSWLNSNDNMNVGGIINLLKKTNPEKYEEYKNKYINTGFYIKIDTLDKGEAFVCNHIVKYLKDICVYTQKRFFVYNKKSGLWSMNENLYTLITSIVNACIDGGIGFLTKKLKDDLTTEEKDKLRGEIKTYHGYYSKISKTSYVNAIEKNLKNQIKDDSFYEKLDSKINIMSFKNGIFDMKTQKLREYCSEDKITKILDFNYEQANKIDIDFVKHELLKICNMNKSHMEYYISCLSQSLTGERLKVLYFLIGLTGNNGKSMILDVLERIFPIYVTKIPNSVISKDSNDKHKFLPKLTGKRCVYIEELDKKKLNENFLKEISGNDKMNYNVMYGCNADLLIRFNLFMISNHSPNLTTDGGIRNRNRLITFESQFPQETKEDDYENKIFIQDKTLGDKLTGKYRNAIVSIIIDYAQEYYIDGYTKSIPKEFRDETEQLNNANEDKVCVVLKDMIVKDAEGNISKTELTDKYKQHSGNSNVNSRDLNDKIKLLFGLKYEKGLSFGNYRGKRCRGGWTGISFIKQENDDDNNNNCMISLN